VKSRKQKRRIAARRRILFLERLESREVLAGNVSAIEIQGTAEAMPFGDNALTTLLDLADRGIRQLIEKQRELVGSIVPKRQTLGSGLQALGNLQNR